MEPVALALASNEHYFPGLYCAVTSALCRLDPAREADVRVIDGGISDKSRGILSDISTRFLEKMAQGESFHEVKLTLDSKGSVLYTIN